MKIEIEGLKELIGFMSPEYIGPHLRRAFDRSAIVVQNRAKILSPVDRGQLRASITYQIDRGVVPEYVEVGTNLHYAPLVHEGRPKGTVLPPEPLTEWARRKKIVDQNGKPVSGYAIAAGIYRKGSTPQPFLRDAMVQSEVEVREIFDATVERIVDSWGV